MGGFYHGNPPVPRFLELGCCKPVAIGHLAKPHLHWVVPQHHRRKHKWSKCPPGLEGLRQLVMDIHPRVDRMISKWIEFGATYCASINELSATVQHSSQGPMAACKMDIPLQTNFVGPCQVDEES